jgi:hypothetical protein
MEWRFFQSLEEGIRHIGSHPIRSREDNDPTASFIRTIGKIPLNLPHLIHLECLTFWFDERDVWMEMMVNLLTGCTAITAVPFFNLCFEAIEGLCKLESYPLLPNSFISRKEVAMDDRIILDRPLKEFDGLRVS